MINLNELARGGTLCLGNAGLAVDASAKADAETLADFAYAIKGFVYTLTSSDGDVQLDGNTIEKGNTALFLVQADAGGTITVVKSAEVDNDDLTNGVAVLEWPQPTADNCPIGAIKIKNATAAQFVGGTTLLDAEGITTTYYNLVFVPVEPLTS